jgi:hypothetical protein
MGGISRPCEIQGRRGEHSTRGVEHRADRPFHDAVGKWLGVECVKQRVVGDRPVQNPIAALCLVVKPENIWTLAFRNADVVAVKCDIVNQLLVVGLRSKAESRQSLAAAVARVLRRARVAPEVGPE